MRRIERYPILPYPTGVTGEGVSFLTFLYIVRFLGFFFSFSFFFFSIFFPPILLRLRVVRVIHEGESAHMFNGCIRHGLCDSC